LQSDTKNCLSQINHIMQQPIKTGIASYGMSGQLFQAPFIAYHPGFELCKILQRNTDTALQDYPQAQIVKTYQDLLNDPAIELIIVNTPNDLHYIMAKQALEAGKHILVEKPFTRTSEEAKELISLAKAKNLIAYPFQNRRWDSDFLTVQHLIGQGLLGKINYYEANWDRYRNYVVADTWKESGDEGTGMLFDLGSHLIDQILVLFGMPQSVFGSIRTNRANGKVIDYFDAKLFYPTMEVAVGGNYLARLPRPRFLIHGDLGSFVKYGLDPQEDALKQKKSLNDTQWGQEPEDIWGSLHAQMNGIEFIGKIKSCAGDYNGLFQNLYQAIRENMTQMVLPEQALQTIQVIEAVIESNHTGKRVHFPL
jgi:scyllo-inositol 2-dehydrogenase (NADP+)